MTPIDPIEPLGAEARALLDAARDGLSPDLAAVRRMRARIQVGAGAGAAIGVKLALLAVVVAAAGAGVALHRREAATVAPRIELASPPEAAVQIAAREAALPPPSDDELIVLEPNVPARRVRAEVSAGEPRVQPAHGLRDAPAGATPGEVRSGPARGARPEPPRDSRPSAITLAREVELLDLAMSALRRGEPSAALRAVQQHAAETAGRGQLAEDAAAIEIEALCHLHDPSTNARLEAFDARYPRSAQRSRLSNRCP